jgi:hypothetical protein
MARQACTGCETTNKQVLQINNEDILCEECLDETLKTAE